jgi:hypothetical protein
MADDNRERERVARIENTLTNGLRKLLSDPHDTGLMPLAARLLRENIHVTQIVVTIDVNATDTRAQMLSRGIAQLERYLELSRTVSSYVPWEDFVFICSRKVDVTGVWIPRIAEASHIDLWTLRYHKTSNLVPMALVEKVNALPDWKPPPERRSNFSLIAGQLVAALRTAGKSSAWIATTLTAFLRDFDGTKVETRDVTMTPPL